VRMASLRLSSVLSLRRDHIHGVRGSLHSLLGLRHHHNLLSCLLLLSRLGHHNHSSSSGGVALSHSLARGHAWWLRVLRWHHDSHATSIFATFSSFLTEFFYLDKNVVHLFLKVVGHVLVLLISGHLEHSEFSLG